MNTNQKGFANIVLIFVVIAIVAVSGYFVFVKKSEPIAQQPTPTPTQTKTPISPTPTPTNIKTNTEKPIITNSSGPVIMGKTKSNYLVWAYQAEQSLTRNTMAVYGAGKADAAGNFSINIPSTAKVGKVNIVVSAFPENSAFIKQGVGGTDSFFPSSNVSEAVTFTATVESHKNTEGGVSAYPDEPLDSIPVNPISVKFLVEHRTALNGKTVTVQGFVVLAALGPNACAPEVCQPRIFLADTANDGRNKDYDTMVLVSEQDNAYTVGQSTTVKGTVASSKVTVYLTKSY